MKLLQNHLLPSTTMIPMLHKYKVISTNTLKPLSTYHKVCLSVIIPHATTDVLINTNPISYVNYLFSFLTLILNLVDYYFLFLLVSVYF